MIEEHGLGVDNHDLLIAVVEQFVVPRLDQDVEIRTLPTLHNPIRVDRIDGEPAGLGDDLTPECIDVAVADIIEIAERLPRQPPSDR